MGDKLRDIKPHLKSSILTVLPNDADMLLAWGDEDRMPLASDMFFMTMSDVLAYVLLI